MQLTISVVEASSTGLRCPAERTAAGDRQLDPGAAPCSDVRATAPCFVGLHTLQSCSAPAHAQDPCTSAPALCRAAAG